MVRSAIAAMLAAVEIYNKTVFSYREEVFCLLMQSAWETLLKARMVQQAGERPQAIYAKKQKGSYPRTRLTGSHLTIGLSTALARTAVPINVRTNIEAVAELRNGVAHLGSLHPELRQEIAGLGTASVQNFVRLTLSWFKEPIPDVYLLPVGFVGDAAVIPISPSMSQRALLNQLRDVVSAAHHEADGYVVSLQFIVDLVPSARGGAAIGPTNDPDAPQFHFSDDALLEMYPDDYGAIVERCRARYSDFKVSPRFHDVMKQVKEDPGCAYPRWPNPKTKAGVPRYFFNAAKVFERLDRVYVPGPQSGQQ